MSTISASSNTARAVAAIIACAVTGAACEGTTPPSSNNAKLEDFVLECDVQATISVEAPSPLSGDVPVTVQVQGPSDVETRYALDFSTDAGATWRSASVRDLADGLHPIPNGTATVVLWNSATDLGNGRFQDVALRATPYIPCGPGQPSIASGLTVVNREPRCTVQVMPIEGPADGGIRIDFTLTYPRERSASARLTWHLNDDQTAHQMTLSRVDCDGDGQIDDGSDLATSPEGHSHCVIWNSQADLVADANVSVVLACWIDGIEHERGNSGSFSVHNDPSPDPDEIRFSEFLLNSGNTLGTYIELVNITSHTLNVQGTALHRWSEFGDPNADAPRNSFVLEDPTDVIAINPGGLLVLGPSADPNHNGCVGSDITWPPLAFTANDNSFYRLELQGTVIDEQSVYDADAWDFAEGIAWGRAPSSAAGSANADVWCEQTSQIPACYDGQTTEVGTPGHSNDPCP